MSTPSILSSLSDRDRLILLQGQTDMITVEVEQRRFFPDGSMEAARSAIRRLCGTGSENSFLQPEPLDSRRVYYRLTPLAAKTLGICSKYATPHKSLGRVRRYAVSWFIHAERPHKRILFTLAECAEHFNIAIPSHRFPKHPFFLDTSTGQDKLGMILVDHNAQIRQIVHKTIRPLERFLRHGWFNEYIMAGSFLVAILTFSSSRQRAIRLQVERAIEKHLGYALEPLRAQANKACIEVLVSVIPGMEAVLTTQSRKEDEE
jgi:hypothetical protein